MDTATLGVAGSVASAASRRMVVLDVLRGLAILGTLATNVWIFTMPGSELRFIADTAAVAPSAVLSGGVTVAAVVEAAFRFLANGKFLALLTILFGAGLAIQRGSAVRRGERWPGRYRWRAALLFLEGTLHFVLVFAFDVLMGYAVTALLVAWLLARRERVQRVAMYVAGGLHVALMSLATAALFAAPDNASTAVTDPDIDLLFTQGSYLDQVRFRLDNVLVLRLEPIVSFGLMVFLFLLGVRLFRAGAFVADERGRAIRVRLAWLGLGVGLPANLATTLAGDDMFLLDRYVVAPLLALGYIGLVGLLVDRVRRPGPVIAGLTGVGRTALSCYVLQNVLCVLVCYGFGLGLASTFADARPWWVVGLWGAVSVTLVLAANLWLQRFSQGPLEAVQKWALARSGKSR